MVLAVLGSGSAFAENAHNAGYLVDRSLLLDCGAPAAVLLHRMGRSVAELETVLISHLHADHVFQLPMLLGTRLTRYPDAPRLHVLGPRGLAEHLTDLGRMALGADFWDQRVAPNPPLVEELEDGQKRQLGPYQMETFEVEHSERLHCLAFRLESQGVSLGYSGDTTYCDGIRRLAKSVQYMLCECTGWAAPEPIHLWREEVLELMRDAPKARFILTHVGERRPVPGALLAFDGMRLRLSAPAGD
jgi:ribonuclease BN (tRNA processing enzyme)